MKAGGPFFGERTLSFAACKMAEPRMSHSSWRIVAEIHATEVGLRGQRRSAFTSRAERGGASATNGPGPRPLP